MKVFLFFSILVLYFAQACLGQEWSDLKQRHVVNPANESYQNFNRNDWNEWYIDRIGKNGTWKSPTITILIGSDSEILSLFDGENTQWVHNGSVVKGQYWSLRRTPMYVMKLENRTNEYDVYNCFEKLFLVAKVDMLFRPIHISGQAENINQNFPSDISLVCGPLGTSSANSLHSLSILSLIVFAISIVW